MKTFLVICALALTSLCAKAADRPAHAVIVVGTHHYSPQKTMPPFAAELERLGLSTTVVYPGWDPEKDKRGLPGLEALAEADVAIFYTRFLKLNDEQLGHITAYLESGKPVVGFRTSTHAFKYPETNPHSKWNHGFGKDALGSPYRIHLVGSTEVKPIEAAKNHPILTGVDLSKPWTSPGTLYLTALQPGTQPLLQGTGSPKGKKAQVRTNPFGTHELKPVMTDTIAWTWTNKWGGRTFTTSLGHTGDFAVPQSMRVMVNGIFWAAGQAVPDKATEVKTFTIAAKAKAKQPNEPKQSDGLTLFYGNSFVERLQEEGSLEALLQAAEADKKLQFRSLAYTGDEVGFRIRPAKFGDHLGYISSQLPCDRVLMCFGMNESFAGAAGLPEFEKNLTVYLNLIKDRHLGSEFILVSPTAVEESTSVRSPDPAARNQDISLYCQSMKRIAAEQKIRYVDLFAPSQKLFAESALPLTLNGLHLNTAGNQAIANVLAGALIAKAKVSTVDQKAPGFGALRQLVSRKAYEVAMAYKPANGIHYYGLRARSFEYDTEIPHHLKLANQLDKAIWKQAADLSQAQPFPKLTTAQAEPPPRKPKRGLGVIKTTAEDLKDFTVATDYEVNAFASSEDFPDLINPLQIHTDAKGRLWVSCVESYPVPVPGRLSNDKILIFEDTNADGKADKQTVYADGLKLPDGFVFYKDGIIVSVARKLLWLRDTDGDDVADVRQELLRGADDTDTHHGGYLSRTPQGDVILSEALFHRGQFETPHGPLRTKNVAILHFDPDTHALSIERQTSHPNPWKISWNDQGEAIQMFGGGQITDCDYYNIDSPTGTTSASDYGMPFRDDKGCTIEFVSSDHFPKEWQGGVITGHLLAKNTVLYTPLEYKEGVMTKAADSFPLLTSSNKAFRPADLEFGLDGALYVSDFYYPIIGHAQHSIRDENRDYTNGRIWRLTRKGAPLSTAPKIAGASIEELLALLSHPQVTVRELVRYELEKSPNDAVLSAAKSQLAKLDKNAIAALEFLWLFERLQDDSGVDLFKTLIASDNVMLVRAAAKSLRIWQPLLGEDAKTIAQKLVDTGDLRTQVSVISAASYLQKVDSSWPDFIQSIDAADGSPISKMKQLASLFDAPPLSPEFPVLKVSPECDLEDWLPNKPVNGGSLFITSDREQPAILGYRRNPYMCINVNGIPLVRYTGSMHSRDGQMTVNLVPGINHIEYFRETVNKRGKTIDLFLANLTGGVPEGVTFAKDVAEHRAWAKSWNDLYATVTDSRIYIKAVPSQLAFNVKDFTVKPGTEYQFIFENPDHMLHNLVITKPGKGDEVGALADAMSTQPDAMTKHYIPDSDAILFSTPQLPHGEKHESKFTTPKEPGKYPYVCTFPGHWRIMRGTMIVSDTP